MDYMLPQIVQLAVNITEMMLAFSHVDNFYMVAFSSFIVRSCSLQRFVALSYKSCRVF